MFFSTRLFPVSLLAALSFATASSAATIYTDEISFLAATGAVAEPPIPDTGSQGSGPVTLGNLTFDSIPPSTTIFFGLGAGGAQWSTALPGNDIAISGKEDMTIKAAFDLSAIGFYIDEPTTPGFTNTDVCNTATCTPSSFDIEFKKGGVQVALAAGIMPAGTLSYFGFDLGTISFDEVVITEMIGTADNEFFGRFSIAAATATIPVPASLPLMLAALVSLGLARRRRH